MTGQQGFSPVDNLLIQSAFPSGFGIFLQC